MGFVAKSVYISSYKSIKVTCKNEDGQIVTLVYPMSDLINIGNVESNVDFGLQINDVPEEYQDSLSVSLSKEEVAINE